MKICWNELQAARLARPYIEEMLKFMEADDLKSQTDYMERYMQLPEETQCALGYMRSLIESDFLGTYSAYGRFCMDAFQRIPSMRLPIRFVGWGGKYNDIGPAYEMDAKCIFSDRSRLFYTDDMIACDQEEAQYLARQIDRESSGIADVRAEKLNSLRSLDSEDSFERWCVTFCLSKEAQREIAVGGRSMRSGANETALFILPRAGEFDCMLGEIVGGDPDNCFILAKHNYCMK